MLSAAIAAPSSSWLNPEARPFETWLGPWLADTGTGHGPASDQEIPSEVGWPRAGALPPDPRPATYATTAATRTTKTTSTIRRVRRGRREPDSGSGFRMYDTAPFLRLSDARSVEREGTHQHGRH